MTNDLDDLLTKAEEHARRVLVGTKDQLTAMFHVVSAKGENAIFATPWENDDQKDRVVAMMRSLMQSGQVARYMFVSEAWAARAPADYNPADPLRVMPRDDPKRSEVVIATASDRNSTKGLVLEIKRDKKGRCVDLTKTEIINDKFSGRMSDMLKRDA